MTELEFHTQRLPLLTPIIEGFISYCKYVDLELSFIDSENKQRVDELLDSKKEVQQLLKTYSDTFKRSEDFLIENNVDIDYSWLRMTQDEWENHKQWENKFVLPYLKKEHPIIHFFKSLKNKTLWQKRKENRPSIFIRSATWLQSHPGKQKK